MGTTNKACPSLVLLMGIMQVLAVFVEEQFSCISGGAHPASHSVSTHFKASQGGKSIEQEL